MISIVCDEVVGRGFFSRGKWRITADWTIPSDVCDSGSGMTFRNVQKGDLEKAVPMTMPQLTDGNARYKPAHRRQKDSYFLLKKVLVDGEGNLFRATYGEIVEVLKDLDEADIVGGLSGAEYVFASQEMFRRR